MDILTKEEFLVNKELYFDKIRKGAVFVYPTDTIYGVGCDAKNKEAVQKIRELKQRDETPFSVIAPRKRWLKESCEFFGKAHDLLDKLPGNLTFILALKHKDCVAENVNPLNDTLGVRMPNHWITDVVRELDFPIITTSVNRHGESYLTDISKLPSGIRSRIDFAIDVGNIEGNPSSGEPVVKR